MSDESLIHDAGRPGESTGNADEQGQPVKSGETAQDFYSVSIDREIGEALQPRVDAANVDPLDKEAQAEVEAARKNDAQMFRVAGFVADDVRDLVGRLPEYEKMTPEQRAVRYRETLAAMKAASPDNWKTDLALARRFIAGHSRLKGFLNKSGLANDLPTLQKIITIARRPGVPLK